MAHEIRRGGVHREGTAQGRIEQEHAGRQRPNREQYELAFEVIADLNVFLVLMGRLIDHIVALGLEQKVPRLTADHCHQPADQGGCRRIREDRDVSD